MSIFDRTIGRIAGVALGAIETVFSRGSLRKHPNSARVIVCLPDTLERFNQAQPNATLDILNANLGRAGHCREVVTSPDLEKYHVYGPNLQELRTVISHICIDILTTAAMPTSSAPLLIDQLSMNGTLSTLGKASPGSLKVTMA